MKSTVGRPRKLSDRQVALILDWHARVLAWKAIRQTLKSQRQLAREFGVSQGTISRAVRLHGAYKQVSPEERPAIPSGRRNRTA
ncbi:MAG TPA: helix-turn-helix domain-containing protein [Anaeromyxobacteraceae bacterium]|nr:helix-turn-helix domain-containing protein [Anaeromyxobacteraceae bacterium]